MKSRRRGFTLIELLVVIAIIAILAAILFPVFARARASARQASCLSNCKQLALAILMYSEEWGNRLPMITWNQQWRQLDVLEPYVRNEKVFHCPGSFSANSASSPPQDATETWKTWFGRNFFPPLPPTWRYTDYKIMDNQNLLGIPVTNVRDSSWVVIVIDNTDWWPRHPQGTPAEEWHDGGSNIAFLDGHARMIRKRNYNNTQNQEEDKDLYGARPFWNWGLHAHLWM